MPTVRLAVSFPHQLSTTTANETFLLPSSVFEMNKTAVLFVPGGNAAAGNLLGRIGFYGMGARAATFGEEAETWREIGFTGGVRVSGSW
jgi:hypothetical protein